MKNKTKKEIKAWGVVSPFEKGEITGMPEFNIYSSKKVAQCMADYWNGELEQQKPYLYKVAPIIIIV